MRHLHIFLSSPGDVSRERQLVQKVISQIESERAHRNKLKLELVAWDKPGAGTAIPAQYEPQEAINLGMMKPSECDIVIVIFWARMGTPLSDKYRKPDGSRYRSGTEYEFLDALDGAQKKKSDVLVYRRKGAPNPGFDDPEYEEKRNQWNQVQAFFAEFKNPDGSFQRFFKEYDTPTDLKDLLDQDLRDLIPGYLEPQEPETAPPLAAPQPAVWTQSPYPGLRAFMPDEALIFFGRDRETDDLVNRLEDSEHRFVAVVGASGAGKSSLVAAGLLPALEKNAIRGSEDWMRIRFTPGAGDGNPFAVLALKLDDVLQRHGQRPQDIAKALCNAPDTLENLVSMALKDKPDWAELLFFINQFEELFTLVKSEFRDAFVAFLTRAAKTKRLRIVVTLRADFYHRCLEWQQLGELIIRGQYPLLAPGVGALHKMIVRPAERAGLTFEAGLPGRILQDTGTESGALALLAFALSELYEARSNGKLTRAAYERFGGVQGAIRKRAEETFAKLAGRNAERQSEIEARLAEVFRELVQVDERGVMTRQRAPLNRFDQSAETSELVSKLIDARLLVTDTEGDQRVVEIAHEALLSHWPLLERLLDKTREDLRLVSQLRLAAEEWERNGREAIYLWPLERLNQTTVVVKELQLKLNEVERAFLKKPLNEKILEAWRLLRELENHDVDHKQRAAIGDRLAELGDIRSGVGLREDGLPDIAWCEVPGGSITLEGNIGTFTVNPFYISKYPVTYIQYRSFLKAEDGYQLKRWWEGLTKRQGEPGEQRLKLDNHPAENVSWYDAVAFCCWLTKHLGYEIRLPTEWEWQQAATGGNPVNKYPWGRDWNSACANTNESGLSRATTVGIYPQGASPVGALDMSGNVWEWCLNEYDDPHKTDLAETGRRVVRGGSWCDDQDFARAAYRYRSNPDNRYYNLGFRVVCSSPIF